MNKKIKIELTQKEYTMITTCLGEANHFGDFEEWLSSDEERALFKRAMKKWDEAK